MLKTLYICYFGLREPLVQTQVLPYLRQLSQAGIGVSLLTFEPHWKREWPESERESWQRLLTENGIEWHALEYHQRPALFGKLYDILMGAYWMIRRARQHQIDVLHARSHLPLAMALLAQRLIGSKLIFDLRGLMAEEYADSGIWREGSLVFRVVKWLESVGIKKADQIVVLTRRVRDWLIKEKGIKREKIEVIPCCVEITIYGRGQVERNDENVGRFEVIYSGSVTGLYLLEEMGKFFLELRKFKPQAFLRILTASPAAEAAACLQRIGLSEGDYSIGFAAPSEMPELLRRAGLGLSFRKATFSQIAASPTKIPEYLAAGVPVVCSAGVGDFDELVSNERIGVIVKGMTPDDYSRAASQVVELLDDPDLSARCYAVAVRNFDLREVGGKRYLNVYRRLEGE